MTTARPPVIRLRRPYVDPGPDDGFRVLVDRVWPRGRTRPELRLDAWARELAPSPELRTWFAHDPERWAEFGRRYRRELRAPARRRLLDEIAAIARTGTVTLVFGARDPDRNQARVIADEIESRLA